ncbi:MULTISPECIES: cob(I)yrinic acid a,c-diamide adenosyltransferase [Pyrobaculum]|uniref:Cob(I)alamin adenosyltransferase n=2 Tax=Pyrobaculum aerophilum TaxID=13773 RepID=Q8ZZ95_PYRAE|nr:cob(I)yrinic acid a,c-diamide adenosyltransferase [Pyrobaculum aerophilum]AAL62746.1 cob(I)alamin adenosyltransferase [Pyrobaculum aerophilum str. IM2]MCX8136365.1 cob(I)yrinic acid a,c-diamide adenosyltransferase [Pyrobaculum aerophilum]MCY0890134.1 cob(I)yrinic acid a,c-diamide adenosyltransferase [Pyrobaculum arsenaticum]HII46899.1 cob(I)yrinic acid a,c-diamide adenosyltransferase [Pyrobaculum aerophilum]
MRLAFHGPGKGKTTAALGTALRAYGHGMRILYVGVMKTPYYMGEEVGEYKAMKRLGIDAVYLTELKSPKAALQYAVDAAGRYDVIILDEVLYAIRQGLISRDELKKLEGVESHVIATGNYWHPSLRDIFHLITRLDAEKHYYNLGNKAIKGLDW